MSRTENKVRELLDNYFYGRQRELENQQLEQKIAIFGWGVLCGVIISYTSLFPLCVGTAFGYFISRRHRPVADIFVQRSIEVLEKSFTLIGKN